MNTMGTWFHETPESLRSMAEETALLEAGELIEECLDDRGISRSVLATRLGVTRSEITQRLNGKRNLTVRTLGAMLHALGYRLTLDVVDEAAGRSRRPVKVARGSGWTTAGARYTSTGNSLQVVRHNVA